MMRRFAAAVLLVLCIAIAQSATGQTPRIDSLRQAISAVGGRAIVTLKSSRAGSFIVAPGADPVPATEMVSIQQRLSNQFPIQVRSSVSIIGALIATVADTAVASLLADPNVYAIEADVRVRLTAAAYHDAEPPVRRFAADAIPWGVSDVGAPAAWAAGLTGAGVKVGIMDTGIDITHPDLVVVGGYDFTTASASPSAYTDNVASCGGHGTHVAGTVAARQNNLLIVGVAPNASLYALKVFEDDGAGCFAYLSTQVAALQWAVTNHLDVISISIANTQSLALDNAVANAVANNVAVVAAAGNDNGGPIVYPAASVGAIAVAALDAGNTVASYSNIGPQMWVAAPGTNILSTIPGGGTGTKSGTSMATPHVTGVVALLKQANPTWTVAQIKTGLQSLAHDLGPAGFDNASGWGLVQAPTSGGTAPPPTVLAVSPAARSVSVQQGSAAPSDNATVTLTGTNASTTAWSATKKQAWNTLTTASGTGSGSVAWTRNATGLAVGTYVDTITVTAAGATGSPTTVFDTLKITPIPVVLAVSPAARSVSVQQGNAAPSDNATVTLTGTNASTTAWSATKKRTWNTLTTASGTGSGTVGWTRNATGLAVGTYVDTITVTAAGATGSPTTVFDTLKITPAPIPVVLAVSPAARSVSVQQGNAAPSDNATVTLTGTNASTTAWSATKKRTWNTLTTSSGTGSGTISWTRNATGLAVGTYVDTITVTAAGATGSPTTVFDTLKITPAPIPVVLAVSPAARSVSVQQGNAAPSDNATVTLTGTNASTTAWSATKKQVWNTLTTTSGTGSGTVTWTRNATGLAVGTYVDTITVTSPGITGSPAMVFDTLKITAAPVPVVLAVSPAARSVSVQQGNAAPSDNATVTLTGTNAGTTAWSATKKQAWNTLTAASGTGSGTVTWTRNATGLAVGTYVDTITVTSPGITGSPAIVFDTLKITAAPVPVVLAVSPAARSVSVQQGNAAPSDNATVTLTGTNASTTAWSATKKRTWNTLTTASGTGSGTVSWSRNATGLAVGTYVDTITVTSPGITGSPAMVFDTLKITAAPVPVVLAVSPAARSVSVQQGNAAPSDNATVTLTGTNASTTAWSATKKQAWNTLTTASGTGSGTVSWSRNATGLAVGTYVDTITVTAAGATGSPTTVFDTLKITAAPIPVVLAVSPAARSVSVQQGNAAPSDNATVTLTGTNASTTTWSATKKRTWNTLTTASGTGSGMVGWTRNATGLAVGTYVDTITVTSPGITGSPAIVFDTLKITAAPVPVVLALSPAARSVSVQLGNAAPNDNATVTLTGTGASSTAWSATKKQAWTTLTTASGTGSGSVAWTRNSWGLAVGTYVDTITVTSPGITGSPATVFDTLKITAAPIPVVLAVSPAARSVSVQQGNAAPSDNATVTLTGTNASTTAWSATKKQTWITLTTASGTGSGSVSWSRNATGLAVGTYVDTITVTSPGITGSPAMVFDTLKITPAPIPVVLAVTPGARSVSVQQGTAAPGDNATVTLTGTGASSTAWSATKKQTWNTLTTSSGTGSGTVGWARNATGLAVGTYVDTITVTSPGITGSPATVFDTLRITAAPIPVVLAVSPAARSVSVQQGNAAPGDNATVTLTGTGAGSTAWSAAKKQAWNTLTTSSGTGSGTVSWARSATGLAVGTYVDTITVTAAGITGSPAVVFDTLRITAAPIPVVLALSPAARGVSVQQGNAAPSDNATVTLTGTNASSTAWTATKRQSWTALTTSNGVGSGTVSWSRNATGLAPGTYVDTITVTAVGATGSPAVVLDTLRITAAPIAVVLAVTPASQNVSVAPGGSAPSGSAVVTLTGTNASSTAWTATKRQSWTTLTIASGTGNGVVTWNREISGLASGTYVDTITVSAAGVSGSPAVIYDTLRLTALIALNPGGRAARRPEFANLTSLTSGPVDSALVESFMTDNTVTWIASTNSPRLQLISGSGVVNTFVKWTRSTEPLAAGMYVDTVVVSLQGNTAARALYVDSLTIVAVTPPAPDAAVNDLFDHGSLTDDQRTVLDALGNNNGQYDLGDFLAWVNRNHIALSASIARKLRQLPPAGTHTSSSPLRL